MRLVVFGAGAVGSLIGGRVHQHSVRHGHDVTLVARGRHLEALRANGLTLNDPSSSVTLDVPVVGSIGEVELRAGDAVFLAMKTQDTPGALEDLARVAPPGIAVVCAQNGVENERLALRHFPDVYGICAILPATLIDPGVIDMNGAPKNAILDIGRYPAGSDATAEAIAEMLEASDMPSVARRDIMRWKYYKLVMNLVNAIDALLSDPDAAAGILQQAKEEAATCFAAAGIEAVDRETFLARSKGVMEVVPIPGREHGGGSTWQSLARGAGTTEIDWLNGEIVLLGRVHGIPTPVNSVLCELTNRAASSGQGPRSITAAQVQALL